MSVSAAFGASGIITLQQRGKSALAPRPRREYGLDPRTADRIYSDYRSHRKHKKRTSFLEELLD